MRKQAMTYLFASGLLGLAASAALYGLGINHSGELFSVSLVIVVLGGLASALAREGRVQGEDLLTMIAGLGFSIWLLGKTFL